MLTYPDKQRFEQLRAYWEQAQYLNDNSRNMAGSKDKGKAAAKQVPNTDEFNAGPSKLRRKISYGLSLISNPLGQRKVTRDRDSGGIEGEASASVHHNTEGKGGGPRRLFSRTPASSSQPLLAGPSSSKHASKGKVTDSDVTPKPKPLPRSRTMSYIPRPPLSDLEPVTSNMPSTVPGRSDTPENSGVTSTRIPSPTPQLGGRRRLVSARQDTSTQHTVQQEKHIAAGAAFAGSAGKAPVAGPARSYTTSNLRRSSIPVGPSFLTPRKTIMKPRVVASSSLQRPGISTATMKENTPTTQTARGVPFQRAMYNPRRESLAPPKKPSPGLSPGSGKTPSGKGKQAATAASTSPSNLVGAARTPPTVKRIPSGRQPAQSINFASASTANLSTQPRLRGPANPPTPTPSGSGSRRLQSRLPSLGTEGVYLGNPLAHGSQIPSLSARGLVGGRGEVRIPRSSTFHHIPRPRSIIPPVPPIPEKYKTPPKYIVPRVDVSQEDPFTDAAAISSPTPPPIQQKLSVEHLKREDSSTFITDPDSSVLESTDEELPPLAVSEAQASSSLVAPPRPFTPNKEVGPDANITASSQIKEFMPASWWAGRFQTRLDLWRTDEMRKQLEADFEPEGLAGQYTMDDEKTAMCLIFLQLRDLCVTKEASDSLWEFEYRYRKENRLLGRMITFPGSPSYRKPETGVAKQVAAHYHRAARRVASGKSSLAGLFKGKGKEKAEEGEE